MKCLQGFTRASPGDSQRRFPRNHRLSLHLVNVASFFVVFFLLLSNSALRAEVTDDVRATLEIIEEALRTSPYPTSGRGNAVVVEDLGGEVKKRFMDFRFKGALSRTDAYSENGKKNLEGIWIAGPEKGITFNGFNVSLRNTPEFHQRLGYDFIPTTYGLFKDIPLAYFFERLRIVGKADVEVEMRDDQMVHVVTHYDDGEGERNHGEFVLDPSMAFRLVSYTFEQEGLREGFHRSVNTRYAATWKKSGSTYYIEKVRFDVNQTRVFSGEAGGKTEKTADSIEISILDFEENADVQDSDFTLDGLNLPQGTMVVDGIAGVNYRYRGEVETSGSDETIRDNARRWPLIVTSIVILVAVSCVVVWRNRRKNAKEFQGRHS